jgi:uncharacterized protein
MGKLLAIGIIVGLIYVLFIKPKNNELGKNKSNKPKQNSDEDMIECKKCGVYTTIGDSIMSDGFYYCSNECAGLKS